jgi:hypothetical protein
MEEEEVVDHLYFGGQQLAAQQMANGVTPAAVPELLEPLCHLLAQSPLTGEIEIHEGGLRIQTEVAIADVAPADQRQLAIHQQQLVVHPVVDAAKAEQPLQQQCQRAPAPQPEGVEQPYLDPRVVSHHLQKAVITGIEIIHQQLHLDAAPSGVEQLAQQQLTATVLFPAVVLRLDPLAGMTDPVAAHLERQQGIVDQGKGSGDHGVILLSWPGVITLPSLFTYSKGVADGTA